MPAGVCKRCGEPTGSPDGRRWYCESCRVIRVAESKQPERDRNRLQRKPRKPCYGCGGDKGPGMWRVYCDACAAKRNALPEQQRPTVTYTAAERRERARVRATAWYDANLRPPPKPCATCGKDFDWPRKSGRRSPWCDDCREDARVASAKAQADRRRHELWTGDEGEWRLILEGDPCCYCGAPMEHVDHVEARAVGGTHDWTNLTAACGTCNHVKHVKPLLAFLLDRAAVH